MSATGAGDGSAPTRSAAARLGRWLLRAGKRAYAAALIVIIAGVTVMAFRYLVRSILAPTQAPERITQLPTRLGVATLTTQRTDWAGLELGGASRTPLSHYHRLESWIQPDRVNGCATSGCHNPLPHAQVKENRAFLNMHATVLHCGVCHFLADDRRLSLVWYDLQTGNEVEAPALLKALTLIESVPPGGVMELAQRRTLVELVRRACEQSGHSAELTELARQFDIIRPASEQFAELVAVAAGVLARHMRSEYGAKLAIKDPRTGAAILSHPGTARAVEEFLKRTSDEPPQSAARRAMAQRLHPLRRTSPRSCTECHRAGGGLIDFAALGFPPSRIRNLTEARVFEAIERIAAEQPLYLPGFVLPDSEGGDGP
ncbi:MAG: hypothetical protein C4547_02625 [Phycisphaerales bacterium]|nr:MAG: hypothetical protein C4547_02625 [Phycisphaerales bacterium]